MPLLVQGMPSDVCVRDGESGSEISLEQAALLAFEAADGLFLDLAHALACEVELGTDFLEGHFLTTDTEEHLENLPLAFVELTQSAVHFVAERLAVETGIGHGGVVVGEDVEQAVVLAFYKGSIHGDVAAAHFERIGDFVDGHVKRFGEFLGRWAAFVFLLEFGEGFTYFVE